MAPTRRTTLKSIGAASGLAAISGTALASDEHKDDDDDERRDDYEEEPDDEPDAVTDEEDDERPEEEPEPIEPPETGVRVAHFSPDAPNVDVYLADDPVLEDVPYRTVSAYLELDAGDYPVRVTAAGDPETVVFDEEITIEQGTIYSAFAIGLLDPPQELQEQAFEVLIVADRGPEPAN